MDLYGSMYSTKCDYCDEPATTIDSQHLCYNHYIQRKNYLKAKKIVIDYNLKYNKKSEPSGRRSY